MKILLTGAAGFIGSHCAQRMIDAGHDVVGVDSFDGYLYPSSVKRENAAALHASLPAARFSLHEADVADEVALGAIVEAVRPDVVCHLAALAGVRPSLAEPLRYTRANVHGTTVILEACRRFEIPRLVFASSSSVYGAKNDENDLSKVVAFREDDPCLEPASPYAATKRAGELMCSTYRDLFGIGISALRFFTVYGPRQRPDMAIHKFTAAIAAGRAIPVFGDGSTRRDYTFIDDIVSGVVAACERVQPGRYELYNLGGTVTTSLSELIAIIEETVGKKAVIDRQPLQPGDVPITYADVARAARDLGYAPTTPVREGVAHFWAWYREHRLA
ncbi:MAG: NAD-dependent epimerase/dehydratase family protein [Kofleriaceae bacterium]|nr:MAG: NAD-dependent epimerase/dehydratase family protein [Kofleriaceae bacterium]